MDKVVNDNEHNLSAVPRAYGIQYRYLKYRKSKQTEIFRLVLLRKISKPEGSPNPHTATYISSGGQARLIPR